MSNVIQFLESLGNNPALSAGDYIATIAALEVNEAQRRALMERDHAELSALLGGRAKVAGYVATPSDEDWKCDDDTSEFVENNEIHQAA